MLSELDVFRLLSVDDALDTVRQWFASSKLSEAATPRRKVEFEEGNLVFTCAATGRGTDYAAGFRVYGTFTDAREGRGELTAYWTEDGQLACIALGAAVGILRVAAICGLAMDLLSPRDIRRCAVLGSGPHAMMLTQALVAVRPEVREIAMFSRRTRMLQERREQLAAKLARDVNVGLTAADAVRDSDVVICATNSAIPVFELPDLYENATVISIGPKSCGAAELAPEVVDGAEFLVTDSLKQLARYKPAHMFEHRVSDIIELRSLAKGQMNLKHKKGIKIFGCTGISGIETFILRRAAEKHALSADRSLN